MTAICGKRRNIIQTTDLLELFYVILLNSKSIFLQENAKKIKIDDELLKKKPIFA